MKRLVSLLMVFALVFALGGCASNSGQSPQGENHPDSAQGKFDADAYYARLESCVKQIREKTDFVLDIVLVLGSGLGDYADSVKIIAKIPYSTLILDRIISCLSSAVISFKMGIFPFSLRDDRWHLPRFRCSNSLAEKSLFRQLNFCNFPKRISKRFLPWYNSPCLILTEVLEMDNKKTCADCINLGREVYCMKCKRLKNGYKDLFVDAAPVQAKPPVASKK